MVADIVDYQEPAGYLTVPEDTYEIAVEGIIPGGNAVVIGPVDLKFMGNTDYDIIAVNSVDAIELLVLADTGSLSDAAMVRVRVAHLAHAAPEVKVFVTAPDAEIAGTEPCTFAYRWLRVTTMWSLPRREPRRRRSKPRLH